MAGEFSTPFLNRLDSSAPQAARLRYSTPQKVTGVVGESVVVRAGPVVVSSAVERRLVAPSGRRRS